MTLPRSATPPAKISANPMKTLKNTVLLLGLAGLVACGGAQDAAKDGDAAEAKTASVDGKKDAKADATVPVETAQVAKRAIQASYNGTASLEAPNEAQVVAKTSGVLLKLLVEEGDRVRAGQVLAKIDPERPRLEVQRAEALLRKLEAEMNRSKELYERKLVAADLYEKIRYDVATQKAQYDMARLELSYTDIVAPIDGVIASRSVKLGNLIQLNSSLFRLIDAEQLEAVLNVPERELATMKKGAAVAMQVDALPGKTFTGTIDRVSPVVDAGSGTFRVTCAFESKDELKPGMFGRIGVVYDQRADALTVPRTALLEEQGETAVYAVRDNIAVRVPVQIGYLSGDLAEIRSGLAEGESVVTAGKITLRDGTRVEVLNAVPAVAPEAAIALRDSGASTASVTP